MPVYYADATSEEALRPRAPGADARLVVLLMNDPKAASGWSTPRGGWRPRCPC
jgi:hypothetical protein